MILSIRAAGAHGLHYFSAPSFDLTEDHPIDFENFLDDVENGLEFSFSSRRNAERIFLLLDILDGLNAGIFAHGKNQPIPGWEYADGAERNFFLIKAAAQVGHAR